MSPEPRQAPGWYEKKAEGLQRYVDAYEWLLAEARWWVDGLQNPTKPEHRDFDYQMNFVPWWPQDA